MTTINTQNLQQQILDDFAFHLGYNRDTKTGGYKRDLFHICHSPFRRLNYNTMVMLYNYASQIKFVIRGSVDWLYLKSDFIVKNFQVPCNMAKIIERACICDTPIETLYLQYAKKKRTILCHKYQIKFSSCEAGQIMKEDFEKEYYSYVH